MIYFIIVPSKGIGEISIEHRMQHIYGRLFLQTLKHWETEKRLLSASLWAAHHLCI